MCSGLLHNCPGVTTWLLLDRLKAPTERQAYARAAIEHGWSCNVLNIHIETRQLEQGAGFAFVGRQVLLDVGSEEFFIDLCSTTSSCAATW